MPANTLWDCWTIVRRRRALVGLTMASAVLVALAMSFALPSVYESVSEFYVVSDPSGRGPMSAASANAPYTTPLVVQDIEKWYLGVLESEAVRRRVAAKAAGKTVQELDRDVDIEFTRKHIALVRVRDRDPTVAAGIAAVYPQALSEFLDDVNEERGRKTLAALDKALAQVNGELEKTQESLRVLLGEKGSPSVTGEIQRLLDRKTAVESELAASRARLQGIERRVALTSQQMQAEANRSATVEGNVFNPAMRRLRDELADTQAEFAAARAQLDEKHPRIISLRAKINRLEQELEAAAKGLRQGEVREPGSLHEQLRRDLAAQVKERAAIRAEAASSEAALASLVQRVGTLQVPGLREQEIRTEIARLEKSRDMIRMQQRETLIQRASNALPVVVLGTPSPAEAPKFPMPAFNGLVAALLGLIAGVYVAFACDYIARARSAGARREFTTVTVNAPLTTAAYRG